MSSTEKTPPCPPTGQEDGTDTSPHDPSSPYTLGQTAIDLLRQVGAARHERDVLVAQQLAQAAATYRHLLDLLQPGDFGHVTELGWSGQYLLEVIHWPTIEAVCDPLISDDGTRVVWRPQAAVLFTGLPDGAVVLYADTALPAEWRSCPVVRELDGIGPLRPPTTHDLRLAAYYLPAMAAAFAAELTALAAEL